MRAPARSAAVVLVAICAVALAACGGGSGSGKGGGGSSSSGGKKLAFVSAARNNPFFNPMECGIRAQAKADGASVNVQAPAQPSDVPGMVQLISAVVAQKPNALIIDPIDKTAFNAPLRAAKNAGVKVIFTDQAPSDPSVAETVISSNNVLGGQLAGKALIRAIGGRGTVLLLSGYPAQNSLGDRQKGFEQTIAKQGGITYLGVQYDAQDPVKAAAIVSATLARHPDLVGIFDTAGTSAPGVVNALKRAGKVGTVKVVVFDAGPAQLAEVKAGQVQALVGQSAEQMGTKAVQSAMKVLSGQSVPASQLVPTALITKDNVDQPATQQFIYYTGACR